MDELEFNQPLASHARRRGVLVALLVSSMLVTVGAGAISLAQFTNSQASTGSWTAGTIVLGVSPVTTFTATNIMPGDTGNKDVTVSNDGTGALRYSMAGVSTDTDGQHLADQLDMTVEAGTCASPTATLFSGKLSSALFGSSAAGPDTGDRTLAASASESLCFTWTFPFASDDTYQGAATSTTFTFAAEQTANNP